MAKTLEQMLNETKANTDRRAADVQQTTAEVGRRVNTNTNRRAADIQQTTAEVGKRVNAHTDRRAADIQQTTAEVGRRVNAHTDRRAADIQQTTAEVGKRVNAHSDANHAETRNVIRDEADRTRREIADPMGWPEWLLGIICGILAAIGMWNAEQGVIIKPVQWDQAGNVLKYGPDTFLLAVLTIVFGIFVFFCVSWIIHMIRKHF